MERQNEVLCKVFEILKDEESISKVTALGKLEDGYDCLKENMVGVSEVEYRQAIQTIKENNGEIRIYSDENMELSDTELEKISGGLASARVTATSINISL